ncbi:unnamed protein product [Mycena citricolor]|uniref:Uncharacterized protein n=1 Tax=Mycena citricolor TaxID=2018698 RepID=A0AAD2HLU5_9AGAR|nr:unnamed protein product [Mycena citricolor]
MPLHTSLTPPLRRLFGHWFTSRALWIRCGSERHGDKEFSNGRGVGVTRLVNVMNVLPNVAYSRGGAQTIIVKLLLLVAELSSSMTGLPSRALTPDEVLGINVALRTLQNSLTQLLFASPSIPTPVLATLKPLSGPLSQVATVLGYSGPASTISNVLDRLPV